MNTRKGYSDQSLNDSLFTGNVFCLIDQSLLITNGYDAFSWNSAQKKLTSVPLEFQANEMKSSNKIVAIANSQDLFLIIQNIQYPEHNDFENIITMLFRGQKAISKVPMTLQCPILLHDNVLIGIGDGDKLTAFNYQTAVSRQICVFAHKVHGIFDVKNNEFAVVDNNSTLTLYQFNKDKTEFEKVRQMEANYSIITLQALDNDHFTCSIFDDHGNKKNKIKDCQTKIRTFKKETFDCVHEIIVDGVKFDKLKSLPNSILLPNTLVGCFNKNIFLIDITTSHVCTIDLGNHITTFSVTDNGKFAALINDSNNLSHLIEIELSLLEKIYLESLQNVSPSLKEEKKDISEPTIGNASFFSASHPNKFPVKSCQLITAFVALLDDPSVYEEVTAQLPPEKLKQFKLAIEEKERENQLSANAQQGG